MLLDSVVNFAKRVKQLKLFHLCLQASNLNYNNSKNFLNLHFYSLKGISVNYHYQHTRAERVTWFISLSL